MKEVKEYLICCVYVICVVVCVGKVICLFEESIFFSEYQKTLSEFKQNPHSSSNRVKAERVNKSLRKRQVYNDSFFDIFISNKVNKLNSITYKNIFLNKEQ